MSLDASFLKTIAWLTQRLFPGMHTLQKMPALGVLLSPNEFRIQYAKGRKLKSACYSKFVLSFGLLSFISWRAYIYLFASWY